MSEVFETRILELFRLGFRKVLEEGLIEKMDLGLIRPEGVSRAIALDVKTSIYGEHKEGAIIIYPSSWIEAIKDRFYPEKWMPDWIKKKYPTKYTTKTVKFQVLYPDFKPPKGNMTSIVKTLVETDEDQDDLSRW